MAYDLDRPNVLVTLESKVQSQEANLRGLNTYSNGARYILAIAAALFIGALVSWYTDYRTLAGWLVAYAVLAWVTHYLFAPLLDHHAQSTVKELEELKGLYAEALRRQKERNS